MVPPIGYDPISSGLQSDAMTTFAREALNYIWRARQDFNL